MSKGPLSIATRGTLRERFYARAIVKPKGCWGWRNTQRKSGYAEMTWGGRNQRAHRLSWLIHVGPIARGMCVLHRCDNPICTNPKHLFLGTHAANVKDKVAKRRQRGPQGSLSGSAKLTESLALEIRQYRGALTGRALARYYGVSTATVSMIRNGHTWKHVGD